MYPRKKEENGLRIFLKIQLELKKSTIVYHKAKNTILRSYRFIEKGQETGISSEPKRVYRLN